jgi:hypothetical protein
VKRSQAFLAAERARRSRPLATPRQRSCIAALSREAGIEVPKVHWARDASDAIDRLKSILREPMLEGFGR